jgi:hypothetical protein
MLTDFHGDEEKKIKITDSKNPEIFNSPNFHFFRKHLRDLSLGEYNKLMQKAFEDF